MPRFVFIAVGTLFCSYVFGADEKLTTLQTSSVRFKNPPQWVSERLLESTIKPIENFLQWEVRRVNVFAHTDANEFEALHHGGPRVAALFRKQDGAIHLGPKVTAENFAPIFAHEWVHAALYQKYRGAIPAWLEEGLANYLGKVGSVDYEWLVRQPIQDVRKFIHPLADPTQMKLHYQTSTAVTQMIASKCSLSDLLQLSVGKKLETYLSTYCQITDVNQAYRDWLAKHQKNDQSRKYTPQPSLPTEASGVLRKSPTAP